jgi:hypothetical protein
VGDSRRMKLMPLNETTIADPWNRIIAKWRRSNVAIRPGLSADAIAAFQSRYRIVLPPDVQEYFRAADGTGDEMDADFFRFWPLDEVKPVHEELAGAEQFAYADRFAYPDCFVFADYSIHCWEYAVKLNSDPTQPAPVFRVTGHLPPGEQMASSFREFMERYADNSYNIM